MTIIETIRYYALTDIGLRRTRNEDAYMVHSSPDTNSHNNGRSMLFAVADGIGGHSCGDRASQMACNLLKSYISGDSGVTLQNSADHVEEMMRSIDREIKQGAIDDPDCEAMGTTLSAIVFAEENAYLAHVGDSRIYRLRNGYLEQLTNDNTFVQEMIDEGELTEEEALFHPLRSMLTRALGTSQPLEGVEIASVNIVDGDSFLLCSDGLHGLVSSRTIEVALLRHSLPEKAARTLLQTALDKGGNDNITIIVIHI